MSSKRLKSLCKNHSLDRPSLRVAVMLVIAGLGFYLGRETAQMPEITQETKVQKQVVVKERIVKVPGGKEIITRTIEDKSRSESLVKITPPAKEWLLGLSVAPDGLNFADPIYTLSVDKRVLGGAYIGLYGRSDGEVGVGVKFSF